MSRAGWSDIAVLAGLVGSTGLAFAAMSTHFLWLAMAALLVSTADLLLVRPSRCFVGPFLAAIVASLSAVILCCLPRT